MYKINFNHLFYFLTIVEQGSIVKASEKLNMSQPAMSHQLKNLELDIGKPLFDRIGNRLALNGEGEIVYKYAKEIFQKSEELIESVQEGTSHYFNFVKIGVSSSMSLSHTYNFIKPLLSEDKVRVQVISGSMNDLLDKLMDKKIDLVLCDLPYGRLSSQVYVTKIRSTKIACYANPRLIKELLSNFPESLQNQKIITYVNDSCLRGEVNKFFSYYDLKPRVCGEFSDPSLVRYVIENSLVVGFLPVDMAKNSLRLKKLSLVNEIENSHYDIWTYSLKKSKINEVLKAFLIS